MRGSSVWFCCAVTVCRNTHGAGTLSFIRLAASACFKYFVIELLIVLLTYLFG